MASVPAFTYRLDRSDHPDGSTLVLLHGTGGSETDLLPLGRSLAPHSALLGMRGRSAAEGSPRWFRRITATTFDQANLRSEASAFSAFLPDLLSLERLDPGRVTFFGYSNGANFLIAVMLLYPDFIRRAALLRPMLALDHPPRPSLSGAVVLALSGRLDPYGRYAPAAVGLLRTLGAHVDASVLEAGHALVTADLTITRTWLAKAPET